MLWRVGLAALGCALVAHVPLRANAETIVSHGWRGDGSGRYLRAQPPTKWSENSKNILWKIEPGKGYSSPVLCRADGDGANRVFLTAEPADLLCIDAATGEILWRQTVDYAVALGPAKAAHIAETHALFESEKRALSKKYDPLSKSDPESPLLAKLKQQRAEVDQRRRDYQREFPSERRGGSGNAAATVVCDHKCVFAAFGTGIVAAFSIDGRRLWARHVEGTDQNFGHAASPVLAGGQLIVHFQKLTALDPSTGSIRWRVDLPAKFGTPAVARVGGEDIVISPSGAIVAASDGRLLAEKQFRLSNNSPIVNDGVLYVHESGTVKAFRLPKTIADPFTLEPLWESSGARDQRMASAVFHDGLLYAAGRRGIMDVLDANTGGLVYRRRLEIGELFSSPAMAGGLIFYGGRDGQMLVMRAGRKYLEIAINSSDRLSTTPLFAGRRLYLRTQRYLVCIGE